MHLHCSTAKLEGETRHRQAADPTDSRAGTSYGPWYLPPDGPNKPGSSHSRHQSGF